MAALAQVKESEDLLKSHMEDNEVISLATSVIEKILPSFKQGSSDTPSGKLKSFLKSVDSYFESLEKTAKAKVLRNFNSMRMRTVLKMIEGDKKCLVTCVKGIQDALVEGGRIYKSCLLLPKFTIEVDKKIKECEGQLGNLSQSYDPQSVFASSKENQVISLLDKIKSLSQEKDRIVGRVGELRNLITL